MFVEPTIITPNASTRTQLTPSALQQENELFRGSGGISAGNRALGFKPAFYDMETGVPHVSRFANGLEAPMHVLDGLPNELVESRLENGKVATVKSGVISGFVQNTHFYTREQAALTTAQLISRTQMLSNPLQHNQLLAAWERFVVDQDYPTNLIRPVVEDSWRRCHQFELDPELRHAPIISDKGQLEHSHYLHSDLLNAARPVLERAKEHLYRSDSLILLADAGGMILDVRADPHVITSAGNINLIEGGVWSEDVAGTNAIGTALAAAEPVQLYGAEHFCAGIKHWTCSADVIRDPHDGMILGAVDLSGLTDSYQSNALDFAIMATRLIEANLASDYFRSREKVVEATKNMFEGWKNEGLLAFDRRGRLVKANQFSHQALKELSADLVLTPECRVPALDLDAPTTSIETPAWLETPLRLPIKLKNEEVGTLVVLSVHH
jgi:GAF domain-containing protein